MIKYNIITDEHGNKVAVTATITGCSNAVIERLERRFGDQMTPRMRELATISDSYTGKVSCRDGEEFIEEEMIKYARWKVLDKYHIACMKAVARVENYIYRMHEEWTKVTMREIQRNIQMIADKFTKNTKKK